MRLIRITTNYPSYLKHFYTQRPELKTEPYAVQYHELMGDCFGWADFWTYALGKLGYEVWEPVGNAEPQQKAWAQENGVAYDEKTWLTDIVAAQVKCFAPDVVFFNDYTTYSGDFIHFLRSQCFSIRFAMGWCGAPYSNDEVFRAYNLVLSNIPILVKEFQNKGHRCEYFQHAFEPRILTKIDRKPSHAPVFSFVGSVVKGSGFHNQREQLLRTLLEETELEIWSDTKEVSTHEWKFLPIRQKMHDLAKAAKSISSLDSLLKLIAKTKTPANRRGRLELSWHVDPLISALSKPGLFGLAMYQKLYESQVTLNTHIDISAQFASNMRLYEATGVGTCLMTEQQQNLHELFDPDVEVVTYRSAEEAVEKAHFLISNEEECRKIAEAGQRRTLKNHTFELRAQQLDTVIRKMLD